MGGCPCIMFSEAACCITTPAAPELSPGSSPWLGFSVAHSETLGSCPSGGSSVLEFGGANSSEVEIFLFFFFFPSHCGMTDMMESHKGSNHLVSAVCGWAALQTTAFTSLPQKPSNKWAGHSAVLLHGCLKQSSIFPF